MSELHTEAQSSGQVLICELNPEETLDRIALRMMDCNSIPGLLNIQFFQIDDERKLSYDIGALRTANEYLDDDCPPGKVLLFLKHIGQISDSLGEYLIDERYLFIDSQYIFVDDDEQLRMVCIPVEGRESCSFAAYVQDVLVDRRVLNQINPDERSALREMLGNKSTTSRNLAQKLESLELQLAVHQRDGRGVYRSTPQVLKRPERQRSAEGTPVILRRPGTRQDSHQDRSDAPITVLRRQTPGQQRDGALSPNRNPVRCHLIRQSTGEQIELVETPFLIGSDSNRNHYCIHNNPAISRNHAVLSMQENGPTLEDIYSKNGTYLNGNRLEPGCRYPLSDNAVIMIANEVFRFLMDE